jgi:Tfp pilus assembly protein FimT
MTRASRGIEHLSANKLRARPDLGFTLADLSVTLSVFAVLLLALVPVLSRLLDAYHLRGATQQVFAELQRARMSAVTQNNRVQLSVVSGSPVYVVHDDKNSDDIANDGTGSVVEHSLDMDSPGVVLASDDVITFAPNGAALNTGRITLANRFGSKTITVGAGGHIRLE